MRFACLAFATFVALCAPAGIAAQAPPAASEAAYRSTIEEAVREFGAGRFEEARALFKRAHELSPNARTLRGLGMTAFELRAYVQAIRELTAALEDKRKPLEGELRSKVQALLEKARKFVGVVRIELEPKDASLLVDGKPPVLEPDGSLLLDAGTHVFSATAPKHKATNMRLLIEGDTKQTVKMPLESTEFQQSMIAPIDAEQVANQKDEPAAVQATEPKVQAGDGSAVQTWAIATLIGAGVFGATATVFWFVGDSQYKELEDTCAPGCSGAEIDDSGVKTSDLLTNVFLGLGAASLVTSGVLFVIGGGGSGETPPAGAAALQVTPLGARITGSF